MPTLRENWESESNEPEADLYLWLARAIRKVIKTPWEVSVFKSMEQKGVIHVMVWNEEKLTFGCEIHEAEPFTLEEAVVAISQRINDSFQWYVEKLTPPFPMSKHAKTSGAWE